MNYLPPVTNETKSRCPCVLNKRQSVTKCRCLNCEYREKNHDKISCPCGESDKKPELQNAAKTACTDVDGQRWQNVVAVRMGKLVPLFFYTRNVEMLWSKRSTVCLDLSPTEDERSPQVLHLFRTHRVLSPMRTLDDRRNMPSRHGWVLPLRR